MAKLIGIVNITPDSFSDGNNHLSREDILTYTEKLITDGADIIDVGAESTRPGAISLSAEEEWKRLKDILGDIIKLTHKHQKQVSLDSYHPKNIKAATDLGIDIANDVSGFNNTEMINEVKNSNAKIILMHNLGIPADKKITIPENQNIVDIIYEWAEQKFLQLEKAGIEKNRIIFDPGIGFGKTAKQSLELIKNCKRFLNLGVEILYGHSRKSCFSELTESAAQSRDFETVAASLYLKNRHINYLRVHNVAAHRDAFRVASYLEHK